MDEERYTCQVEAGWQNIPEEFNVEPRNWLQIMYDKCQHLIKCYLNDTFWIGMTTTTGARVRCRSRGVCKLEYDVK